MLISVSSAANAQMPYTTEQCGFSVSLPEAPYITTKCDTKGACYQVASFTKLFDMQTSLRADVICNPITAETAKRYNRDVMVKTLEAMTDPNIIKTHQTYSREEDGYKQVSLIGQGLQGQNTTLYMAQLWLDDASAFSIEAEIVGEASDEADKMLSGILHSITHKNANQAPKP